MEKNHSRLNQPKKLGKSKLEMAGSVNDIEGSDKLSQFNQNLTNVGKLEQISEDLKPSVKIPIVMATGLALVEETYDETDVAFELFEHPNLQSQIDYYYSCFNTKSLDDDNLAMDEDLEETKVKLSIKAYLLSKGVVNLKTLEEYLNKTDNLVSKAFEKSATIVNEKKLKITNKLKEPGLILDISEFA